MLDSILDRFLDVPRTMADTQSTEQARVCGTKKWNKYGSGYPDDLSDEQLEVSGQSASPGYLFLLCIRVYKVFH